MALDRKTLKLMAPLSGALALMWVLAGLTLHDQHRITAAYDQTLDAQARVHALGEIRSLSRSLQRDAVNLATEQDPAERATITTKFATRMTVMHQRLSELERLPGRAGLPGGYFNLSHRVLGALRQVAVRAQRGDHAGALVLFRSVVRPAERAASKVADGEIERLEATAAVLHRHATAVEDGAEWTLVSAVLLLTAAGLSAGFVITRNGLIRPLHQLRASMGELAARRHDVAVPHLHRRDEIGEMARSLATLRDHLDAADTAKREQAALIIRDVGGGLDSLARGDLAARIAVDLSDEFDKLRTDYNAAMVSVATTLAAVKASTGEIAGGAAEILQASDDLSQRTERQAVSLQQTATAMHQITATVQQTAAGAARVNAAVQQTRDDADRSGETVRQAVAAMTEIEQGAREIGEIIAVIDGIAFQTNLLALNAGVEAARAGDAGKGFAVVAAEVRALAQRSAEAARDVKARITASSAQVGAGVALVAQTGGALERIRDRIIHVHDEVAAIAHAADEQACGLQQVNGAVAEIDQVTRQNATMAELVATAARQLTETTRTMAGQVGRFRLDGERPAKVVDLVRSAPRAVPHRLVA